MIWLSFLAHRESRIPLREWIPFVGRCIDGTYFDRHPVIGEASSMCLRLSPDIFFFKSHSYRRASCSLDWRVPFAVSLGSCQWVSSMQWHSVSILTSKFRRSSYLTVSSIHQSMLLPCSFLPFRILVLPSYVTTSPWWMDFQPSAWLLLLDTFARLLVSRCVCSPTACTLTHLHNG